MASGHVGAAVGPWIGACAAFPLVLWLQASTGGLCGPVPPVLFVACLAALVFGGWKFGTFATTLNAVALFWEVSQPGRLAGGTQDPSGVLLVLAYGISAAGAAWLGGGVTAKYRRILAEVAARTEEANAASLAKSQFLANVGHELRTPLNAIIGYSEMLGDEPLEPRAHRHVDRVLDAGNHLLASISDVLNLSRAATGRWTLEPPQAPSPRKGGWLRPPVLDDPLENGQARVLHLGLLIGMGLGLPLGLAQLVMFPQIAWAMVLLGWIAVEAVTLALLMRGSLVAALWCIIGCAALGNGAMLLGGGGAVSQFAPGLLALCVATSMFAGLRSGLALAAALTLATAWKVSGAVGLSVLPPMGDPAMITAVSFAPSVAVTVAMVAALLGAYRRALAHAEAKAEDARAADEAKAIFLTHMSHELRPPLGEVIGHSGLLLDEVDDAGARDDIGRVRDAGAHLLGLVNDILDMSRVAAGGLELELVAVEIGSVIQAVVTTVEPQLAERGNVLTLVAPAAPVWVRGDSRRVRQILWSLVSNAAKFTRDGTIVLRVSVDAERVAIAVVDSGIGIDPEDAERLFRPFYQAVPGRLAGGGTGLGLALARQLAEQMGGTIELSSVKGEGSSFTVQLPRATAMAAFASTPVAQVA